MAIGNQEFKDTLKLWASGVSVVTAQSEDEKLGMTATSFASVSMDPPQILVCLNETTETGAAILQNKKFAVNILTSEQQQVSNQFAGGSSMDERFKNVVWHKGELGVPVLDESLAIMECTVVHQFKAGTHWVVVGEIQHNQCNTGGPLLYFNSAYQQVAE
ncbi:flavin-dependent trigonelline monooxygenase, reductase component [Bathymodiolus japonicus methanotrophic gill symbiont]|uniref:flavin reductase family protein n=1 Tax=Bathymodiolus japonicus methanotrophic gill symbiont TaxID=113269 RepID=UPI001B3D3F78|nr:flavin reductase family protein [Bathymodiolus japonicus methanotrophic gill symbiont]GFO72227.1 flavin-dependent trigonelline monooxygenase, reductase component [Bathymodiolus japonicus methanotrophic gill symbiont]